MVLLLLPWLVGFTIFGKEVVLRSGETGAVDLGGAASFEIPNGEDTDVVTAGTLFFDTDGANVTGDKIVRGIDGTNHFPVGKKIIQLTFPFNTSGATTTWQPWPNGSGMTFTITKIECSGNVEDLTIDIDEFTAWNDTTILNTIIDLTLDTEGDTGNWTKSAESGFTQTALESGHGFSWDYSAAAKGSCSVYGWFNADVD